MERNSVLVIDDDEDFRELVRVVLEPLGVNVLGAADCRRGLQILARERDQLRLVLLDYFMPGLVPVQCASAITELAGTAIEVVLVTAAADPARRAAELKLSRFLSKPFDLRLLAELAAAGQAAHR